MIEPQCEQLRLVYLAKLLPVLSFAEGVRAGLKFANSLKENPGESREAPTSQVQGKQFLCD